MANDALRIHGGPPTVDEPLPRWPRLSPEQAGEVARCLAERPWALGQPDGQPGGFFKARLEADFSRLVGVRHALAVSSGTAALDLAFEALEVPADRLVVAANYGHPSTVRRAALTHRLLLLDVDPQTLCLDADGVRDALARHDVGCVIATHFAGQPAGADALAALCEAAGVPLVEDASHAHGARLGGRAAGSFGRLGCFSLHATKNLPSAEGGAITFDDDALYARLWPAHDLGRARGAAPYDFQTLGGNFRMSELHAAVALAELPAVEERAWARMARVDSARAALAGGPLEVLERAPGVDLHAHHLVPARYRPERIGGVSRHRFVLALAAEGVPCTTGWPRTLSSIAALRERCVPHPTPIAEAATAESVWLDRRLFDDGRLAELVPMAVAKVAAHAGRLRGAR
jgi:dTDP-4-amino-4,6-dideoxygalactose transaminase